MIRIDSEVAIPVNRDGEDVGEIRFDPNDLLFVENFYGIVAWLSEAESKYAAKAQVLEADKALNEFGLPANTGEKIKLLRELCEDAHRKIDEVFGAGTADICFGGRLSLDSVWQFYDQIVPELDEAQQERIKRYTEKRGNRKSRRALEKSKK